MCAPARAACSSLRVSGVVNWLVADSRRATLDVGDYRTFLKNQAEVVRNASTPQEAGASAGTSECGDDQRNGDGAAIGVEA
jgi:hypothetical protein